MAAKSLRNSRQICQYLEKSQRRIILDSLKCLVAKIPNEETKATTDLLSLGTYRSSTYYGIRQTHLLSLTLKTLRT